MVVPLYIFLFIYLAFLAIFVAFSIINFYHIFATASFTVVSFIMSFFIFAITILTLYMTVTLLGDVNWQQAVFTLGGSSPGPSPF